MAEIDIDIDKVVRSKRRTVGLEITMDALLIVRAPLRLSMKEIKKIVLKKHGWIIKKQGELKQAKDLYVPKRYINGEMFYYLGKPYEFKLYEGKTIKLGEFLEFPEGLVSNAEFHLTNWYKKIAYEKIIERVDYYAGITGLSYSKIKISQAKKRLGSCNRRGNINFSWRLIMAPRQVVDYVVVHELCHLYEMNHSKKFWNNVQLIFPQYRECRQWIRNNAHLLA